MKKIFRFSGRKIIVCAMLLFDISKLLAGNDNYPIGARSAGLASASVILSDVWSSFNNQAGLGYIEKPAASFYYENRLNTKNLSIQAGVVAIPVKSTIISFNYRYFGYSKYYESKIGLAVAKKLGNKFSMGIQMDYFHSHFQGDYGNSGSLCGEIGLLYEFAEHLFAGFHIFNISQSKQAAGSDERIPVIMKFGIGYIIQKKTTISIETEKDINMKAIFKTGLEFVPIKGFSIRCGASTGNIYQYSFGIGYLWKKLSLDISFSHHKFLGYSPHISIITHL